MGLNPFGRSGEIAGALFARRFRVILQLSHSSVELRAGAGSEMRWIRTNFGQALMAGHTHV